MSSTPWRTVPLPTHRVSGKPGVLGVVEPRKLTEGLFTTSPRCYFVLNDTDAPSLRGGHVHQSGGKQEVFVVLAGSVRVELHSPSQCGSVTLQALEGALVIPSGIWHALELSAGAILLCVASTEFAPDECILEKPCGC